MRIRPIFLCILAFVCCALLFFASTIQEHAFAVMQVHVDRAAAAPIGYTTVELHLSDPQNNPIEQAQVISSAKMTNMDMGATSTSIKTLGQGNYRVLLALSMAGPWQINIIAQANGFDTQQQSLLIQVPGPLTICPEVAV